jgi:D-alanyl-D-alanine carboxypeptidase
MTGLCFGRIKMGNFFSDVIMQDPRFNSTKRVADLALLEPITRAAVLAIIADAKADGHNLMVFETYRSQDRQEQLYDQGVTQLQTVGVHHYGLACDIVKVVNGEPNWDGDFSFLGEYAKKHGLIGGGDWGVPDKPHSFRDYDHVQRCSIADQRGLFNGSWYPDDQYDPYGSEEA